MRSFCTTVVYRICINSNVFTHGICKAVEPNEHELGFVSPMYIIVPTGSDKSLTLCHYWKGRYNLLGYFKDIRYNSALSVA